MGPFALPLLGKNFDLTVRAQSLTGAVTTTAVGKVLIDAAEVFAAIVSHDCEFNEGKRNKVLVARLQGVPKHLTPEEVEALKASNDVTARVAADEDIAGLDSFVVDPLDGAFADAQIINLATITPLPMGMAPDLLKAKKGELDQSVRVDLRMKLGWFFGRDAEDVADETKKAPPEESQTESGDG